MKKFRIHYKCVSDLTIDAIWPDGDAPDNPTTADVQQLVSKCGGIYNVLNEWNLHVHDGVWFVEFVESLEEES